MTRWASQAPEKKPTVLPFGKRNKDKEDGFGVEPSGNIRQNNSTLKSYGQCGVVKASPQIFPGIKVPESFYEYEDKEDKPSDASPINSDNTIALTYETEASSNSNSNNDVYKTAIPLPAPPSPQIGNAYGGNQSYINRNSKPLRLPDSSAGPSVTYTWNNSMNSETNVNSRNQREPGDVGLTNLGNTCFMNSGLQCLIHTPPLVEYFLEINNSNEPLVIQVHNMMKNAWTGTSAILSLHEFKTVLGGMHSQFKDCRQHDCQEFLAITLDALHEKLRKTEIFKGRVDDKPVENKPEIKKRKTQKIYEPCITKSLTDSETCTEVTNKSNDHNEKDESGEADDVPPVKKRKEDPADLASKAADYWENHMAANGTVIASTFQGMYKSTVRCSHCSIESVTYEPFMYLSLPIPRVVDRHFNVTFISMKDRRPQKAELSLNMLETVAKLKKEVAKSIYLQAYTDDINERLVTAFVTNHHVFSILDDNCQVKNINERDRNIYVFELNTNFDEKYGNDATPFPTFMSSLMHNHVPETVNSTSSATSHSEMNPSTYLDEDWEQDDVTAQLPPLIATTSSCSEINSTETIGEEGPGQDDNCGVSSNELITCTICLDEFKSTDVQQHLGCSCYLCKECLSKSVIHYDKGENKENGEDNQMKCAVCSTVVDSVKDFRPVGTKIEVRTPTLLLMPVLFRNDPDPDTNNNSSLKSDSIRFQKFAYPWIIRVPSYIAVNELDEFLREINPFPQHPSRFLCASYDGKSCAHCPNQKCTGCEIPKDGMISLFAKNSLVISYSNLSVETMSVIQPTDMATSSNVSWNFSRNEEPTIDIHDCLRSFSEIEHLDSQNPWYCPKCKMNQCATKALSICHLPDYLIVYLKRFVFLDHSSNKLNNRLKFPLTGLDVSAYMAEEFSGKDYTYDLYSCVCHFGSATSGHYTAFGKNPNSGNWHCFNDSLVSNQDPKEEEYSSAYVLFYQRRGVKHEIQGILNSYRPIPERNIPTRPVALVSPNHFSGGSCQLNSSSKLNSSNKRDKSEIKTSNELNLKSAQEGGKVKRCSQSVKGDSDRKSEKENEHSNTNNLETIRRLDSGKDENNHSPQAETMELEARAVRTNDFIHNLGDSKFLNCIRSRSKNFPDKTPN